MKYIDWFWIKRPSSVVYVQDVVHIAVKLKSRLLKPSIVHVLPVGNYNNVAGIHHLHILRATLGKNVYEWRHFLINSLILQQQKTRMLLKLTYTRNLIHFQELWYVIFFVSIGVKGFSTTHTTHCKILNHPHYTLQNNFITQNAYMCL